MTTETTCRNPYAVGGVVEGPYFYGRMELIEALLDSRDRVTWIVGNRRIGKSSLLRRLVEKGNSDTSVAFAFSLEGAESMADFARYIIDELDNYPERLARLELQITDLQDKTPPEIMRLLDRHGRERQIEVLLLLDEVEALIGIVEQDGDSCLKELRRAMQRSEALRIFFAATKRLAVLDDFCHEWETSPFLFGVAPSYLGRLYHDSAVALICQTQSDHALDVDTVIVNAILSATDCHPYLTQWLCARLWTDEGLRIPTADDLIPDTKLIGIFQFDYNHLAPIERSILRCLARVEATDEASLLEQLEIDIPRVQLLHLLQALTQLGYVRHVDDKYAIGNQLLYNWLQFSEIDEVAPSVSDAAAVELADEEQQGIMKIIAAHRRRLLVLEEQRALRGNDAPPEITMEIEDIKSRVAELETDLGRIRKRQQ
ncbi:MAG: ATP-binding protein [Chloroflexota bacterium]